MQKWKKKLRKAAMRSKNELKDAKLRVTNQFFHCSAKIQFRVTIFEPALVVLVVSQKPTIQWLRSSIV
jgi:hypothetical protein